MLTIVLAVTMVIFNGMQYIIASGSGNDPKKAQSNLIYIVVGIIIALFSVVIVNLLRSTGTTLYKEVSKNVNSLMSKDISSLS
jgi:type IV secretory pathway VirB2 component (pilin)